ncbi:hypothetical protein ACJX0J_012792, partial [Zea mays]
FVLSIGITTLLGIWLRGKDCLHMGPLKKDTIAHVGKEKVVAEPIGTQDLVQDLNSTILPVKFSKEEATGIKRKRVGESSQSGTRMPKKRQGGKAPQKKRHIMAKITEYYIQGLGFESEEDWGVF